jgi:hypothetical protein
MAADVYFYDRTMHGTKSSLGKSVYTALSAVSTNIFSTVAFYTNQFKNPAQVGMLSKHATNCPPSSVRLRVK